ncbi:Ndr family protein [Cooperia oncophora]
MTDVKNKSIFLHVCVPGQEDNAADYIGEFPTLDQIASDLTYVLDKLDVKFRKVIKFQSCIVFGEGAGANILCRFAMANPNRILGTILVHCTSTTAGIVEYCKDKVINMRLENDIMTDGAWEYLVTHKFGTVSFSSNLIVNKKDRQMYVDELKRTLNPRNLSKYLLSFTKRTDLSGSIGTKLDSVDTLLVSGSKASHLHTVYTTQKSMNRRKTTLLVVDNVADVLQEAPDNMARSFILLCKGCGVLSGVAIPGMERQRTLSRYLFTQGASCEIANKPL